MSHVELMVASGSKCCRIYDYTRDNSPHRVQMRDVYNLIAKIKKSDSNLTDEDQVAELLVDFNMSAGGNVACIDENSRGQTAVVSISSQHMRKMCQHFPELLLVDCTHKSNKYNYQLCALMIMNQFGNDQTIQHSVIERNADWHMVKIVKHFQSVNDWEQMTVIMVDKDLNEIEVLKRMSPGARILLCHFHVIKWLRIAVRNDKYGTYTTEMLKQIDFCVANLVYSKSEVELLQHANEFKVLACRGGRDELWTYLEENWMDSKQIAMSMKQCLEAGIRYQRRREDDYATRLSMPETLRNINYVEEMNQLLGMTSEWLAGMFETEYKVATTCDAITSYTIDD
ncbi:hypothetical protein PI124_g20200 [Phytophthora idaei]|nr:hypothetical protein PI124_g20200 [Phytophthora idaei]